MATASRDSTEDLGNDLAGRLPPRGRRRHRRGTRVGPAAARVLLLAAMYREMLRRSGRSASLSDAAGETSGVRRLIGADRDPLDSFHGDDLDRAGASLSDEFVDECASGSRNSPRSASPRSCSRVSRFSMRRSGRRSPISARFRRHDHKGGTRRAEFGGTGGCGRL
jgi:hypothetical protein